jgi:hypothetical protein
LEKTGLHSASGYNEGMQKKILIIIGFIILLSAAVFVWMHFSQKKSVNIINNEQESIANEQQPADSEQLTANDTQQAETNNQSAAVNTQEDKKIITAEPTDTSKTSSTGKIVSRLVSWGFQKASGRKIDTIVIHSNYNTLSDDPYSIKGAIEQFKMYGVAAHYIVDRDGTIYQLVDEKNIAYHAGVSKMKDGRTDVNDFSIGIELMVKDSGDSPTSDQYAALNSLISGIKKRWPIKYVVGHSDIAPGRKTDPWNIDWGKVDK